MIELEDCLNSRWTVDRPFLRGNSRNFLFYLVWDEHLERPALLKTIRKTDLPSEKLYEWRCQALTAERERLGSLTIPSMPEPLDYFEARAEGSNGTEKAQGDPCIVYSLIGDANGNFLLREKLQRWGFIGTGGRSWRQIDKIAQYMGDLARFTEEMWRSGYVHTNLNPDHLYYLRDGVLRVTGCSAVCRHNGSQIPAEEPGLRNMTIGFQSEEHHRRATGETEEPLDAIRARWNSYAVLALDLIWGRDVREHCADQGISSLELTRQIREQICKDFPAFERHFQGRSNAPPQLKESLKQLFKLLELCLNWKSGNLPKDLYEQFQDVWNELDLSRWGSFLFLDPKERKYRQEKAWDDEKLRRGEPPPTEDDETGDFMVCDYEEIETRSSDTGKAQRSGRYRVVNLSHPGRRRVEMRKLQLFTQPYRKNYFLPGDIMPGVVHLTQRGYARVLPAQWTSFDPRTDLEDGQRMRALSLGRRLTSFDTGVDNPVAIVEIDGALRTLKIRQRPDEQWIIYPRAGEFFTAEYLDEGQRGSGIVTVDPPSPQSLLHKEFFATVRRITEYVFFDLPLGPHYLVSCMIPLNRCPADQEVKEGDKIPVRVETVKSGSIFCEWNDKLLAERAAIGRRYRGTVLRRKAQDSLIEIQFGDQGQFRGVIETQKPSFPWGAPYRTWEQGRPVVVEVLGERPGGQLIYRLRYQDDRSAPRKVEEVLRPGQTLEGKVQRTSEAKGVYVLLSDGRGADLIQVEGLILNSDQMLKKERQDLKKYYPHDMIVKVKVQEVNPGKREILLTREYVAGA